MYKTALEVTMTVTVEDGPYFSAEGSFLSILQIDDPTKASADDGVNEHGLLGSDESQVKEGPETVNVYFKARSKDDDNGQPFYLTTWAGCRIKLP